ncbi:hypothetical protein [Aggregatibacter actinomycetemcomitans]|uniref:hypothetical protein n=1 Tax=Aggregatibacter actinomycetemcomitans TaxID=714 RepID=UPI00077E9A53|nr:hypothetical protein [Aggregatibacter actinomycetemcomitans]KYK91621.1 hypothetical protein SA269_09390 [Aggregatibacter actinomycetemcomitans serotype d str. SA269]
MYPPFLYSIFEQVHPPKTPIKVTALSTTLQPLNIRHKLEPITKLKQLFSQYNSLIIFILDFDFILMLVLIDAPPFSPQENHEPAYSASI